MIDKNRKLNLYYSRMVNWEKRLSSEGPFLIKALKDAGAETVLDCGCGTGMHVIFLRKNGFFADGIDVNPLQIESAVENAAREMIPAKFFEEDMKTLPSIKGESYDAVYSIGNTMCSFGPVGAEAALVRFGEILKPGGIMVGQVLNYQSFDRTHRTETRWHRGEEGESIFLKTFLFQEDHVSMIVNVLEKTEDKWINYLDTTDMYYLDRGFFETSLKNAGFRGVRFYGSLNGADFEERTSRDLVFTAERK